MGAKEGGRELFDDPSYVNVDKPRPPAAAANGNTHRDAFDMSELTRQVATHCDSRGSVIFIFDHVVLCCSKNFIFIS